MLDRAIQQQLQSWPQENMTKNEDRKVTLEAQIATLSQAMQRLETNKLNFTLLFSSESRLYRFMSPFNGLLILKQQRIIDEE